MLNNGNWNGNQIMTDQNYFNQMINTSQSMNLSYGYLWWLNGKLSFMVPGLQFAFPGSLNPSAPADMYAAMGKNGQFINVVPSMNLVFIRMGNSPDASEVPFIYNDSIWVRLNAAMCNVTDNKESLMKKSLSFYPNPAADEIFVDGISSGESLNIVSSNGIIVGSEKGMDARLRINTEGLANGLYFIQKVDEQKRILATDKLVVLRP